MNITDNRIDLGKSFAKLAETMYEIARDESRTNLEKFVDLKLAVQSHLCECSVSDMKRPQMGKTEATYLIDLSGVYNKEFEAETKKNMDDLKDINI